mgnify:CR=1 FL=1
MDDEPSPRDPAAAEVIAPDLDTESAFRLLVARCCAEVDRQIAQFLEQDHPEGAHKARVALRRLTTTLDAFRHILKRKGYAAERALSRLNARKLDTRKCPVLFEAPLASGLLGAYVQATSGGSLYRKASFLLDKLVSALATIVTRGTSAN